MAYLHDRPPRKSERHNPHKTQLRVAAERAIGRMWPAKTRRRNGKLIRFRQSPNKRGVSAEAMEKAQTGWRGWRHLISRVGV
jgi:hypothetical protein